MLKHISQLALLFGLLLVSQTKVFAQKDKIEGVYFNEEKDGKIQLYLAKNGKFYGKIIWLKEPNRDGKPKMDDKNPDDAKHTNPILGLLILKGFVKSTDNDNVYEDGTIYDPKNGKTYSCKITYKDANTLDIRGFIGISLIGRTTTWTRTE
jgi:uncharacterized protein (DUF2147 family)